MGVKTQISLDELNSLFSEHTFTHLDGTTDGIIDTTYIAFTKSEKYILKRHESASLEQIDSSIELLIFLKKSGLNVATQVSESHGWHLYEFIDGEMAKSVTLKHVKKVALFIRSLHELTVGKSGISDQYATTKRSFEKSYYYHKLFSSCERLDSSLDGVIHGDLFVDNAKFMDSELYVYDFIDSYEGSFLVDCAVCVLSWCIKNSTADIIRVKIFLNVYNQSRVKKVNLKELLHQTHLVALDFAQKRYLSGALDHTELIKKSKHILKMIRSIKNDI